MPGREKKHCSAYTKEIMAAAISAVTDDNMSISEAARVHGVPRKTLSDKINGKHDKPNGHPTMLTQEEEGYLVNYMKYMASHCFPLSVKQARGFAWALVKSGERREQFTDAGPSEHWWRGFRKRQKDKITLRIPDTLDRGRGRIANEVVINRHFETLEKTLKENNLFDKPSAIFNVDESGINMECRLGKVIVVKGEKQATSLSKGSRDHITVNCCVSAAGQVVPPMSIYEKCFPSAPYIREGPIGALYGKSPNGYMDEELFIEWFTKLFIPWTNHIGT